MKFLSFLRGRIKAAGFLAAGVLVAAGILISSAVGMLMAHTTSEQFCISCHELRETVYQEYRLTAHNSNSSGVRATCADCHIPKEWNRRLVRELVATTELVHAVLGTIDTPEKFEARRAKLAQIEWNRMKASDSRECRNCHKSISMDFAEQGRRGSAQHQQGFEAGQTCIDCHKGIAHRMPALPQDMSRPQAQATAGKGG